VPFAKLGNYALWLFHCEIFAFSVESLPFFRGAGDRQEASPEIAGKHPDATNA
jgi:hypothetical protein